MKIYSIKEIAKILKCSERQVFRYLASGQLQGSKQGKWRFTDQDVRDFLKRGRDESKK
ncbi:TPA: excisionase [Candidatus Nomurabacteria bacterium]|nr:excisionase [Candidatus Nomurabacteria bacterium]HBG68519.1 excisionase [Candidatus Nomurabacteria bacterium]